MRPKHALRNLLAVLLLAKWAGCRYIPQVTPLFESIEDPQWNGDTAATTPIRVASPRYEPMRKITNPGEKIV